MATSKTKPSDTPETSPDPETTAETETAAVAVVVAPPTEMAAPRSPTTTPGELDVSQYEARIAEAHRVLHTIIEENPEFGASLQEAADYTVARVEGIAGDRSIPIPHVVIRQNVTKEESLPGDTKVGHLYTKQDVIGAELNFIPLYMSYKRVKFAQGNDSPDCYSNDGVIGSKYGECGRCPHKTYAEGARAACSGGRSFAAVSTDFRQLYTIDFLKMSSKTGKRLETLAMSPHGIFKKAFRLYTEKEKNDKGEFFVLRVAVGEGGNLAPMQYKAARALSQYFAARHDLSIARTRHRMLTGDKVGEGRMAAASGGALPAASSDQEPDFGAGF